MTDNRSIDTDPQHPEAAPPQSVVVRSSSRGVADILEKRKLRHSVERLEKAGFVEIKTRNSEEHWALQVTKAGIAYLVESGQA